MILIIAEKPSLARNIVAGIGKMSKYSGYYEGCGYIVTWAFGHLFSLCDIEDYNPPPKQVQEGKRPRWTMANLPCFPEEFRFRLRMGENGKPGCGNSAAVFGHRDALQPRGRRPHRKCGRLGQRGRDHRPPVRQSCTARREALRSFVAARSDPGDGRGGTAKHEERGRISAPRRRGLCAHIYRLAVRRESYSLCDAEDGYAAACRTSYCSDSKSYLRPRYGDTEFWFRRPTMSRQAAPRATERP